MIIIHEVIIDYQVIHTHALFFVITHTSVMQPIYIIYQSSTKYIVMNHQTHRHQLSNTSSSIINQILMQCDRLDTMHVVPIGQNPRHNKNAK